MHILDSDLNLNSDTIEQWIVAIPLICANYLCQDMQEMVYVKKNAFSAFIRHDFMGWRINSTSLWHVMSFYECRKGSSKVTFVI